MKTNLSTCKQYKGTHGQTKLSSLSCKVEVIMAFHVNSFIEINICKVRWCQWHAQISAWHAIILFHMLILISALVSLLTLLLLITLCSSNCVPPIAQLLQQRTIANYFSVVCLRERFTRKAAFQRSSILFAGTASPLSHFTCVFGVINAQCISFISWWLPQRFVR